MEKRSHKQNIFLSLFILLIATFSFHPLALSDEGFPRSSFGKAPERPLLSASDDFVTDERSSNLSPGHILIQRRLPREPNRAPSAIRSEGPIAHVQAQSFSGVQEVSLIAGELGFFPRTVFVYPKTPVRMYLTSSSSNTLCLVMDAFEIRKQIKNKQVEEVTFTPTQPGQYRFYCPINGASGTLVVRDFTEEQIQSQRRLANE